MKGKGPEDVTSELKNTEKGVKGKKEIGVSIQDKGTESFKSSEWYSLANATRRSNNKRC